MSLTITELHEKMTEILASSADDAAKLDSGNAAAGRRLRKALQELKKLAQETRKISIEIGKPEAPTAPAPPTCGEGKSASECCGDGITSLGS